MNLERIGNADADMPAVAGSVDLNDAELRANLVGARSSARSLPSPYGSQWAAETDALLAAGKPSAIIALDTAEKPDHEHQKTLVVRVWSHKKELSRLCNGFVSIEPDRATPTCWNGRRMPNAGNDEITITCCTIDMWQST